MRKLVLKMSVSLDGFVSGPDGEIDWVFRTGGDESRQWVLDTLWRAGAHAMGSRSYRTLAAFWPSADSPLAAPMNEIPKIVFTRKGLGNAPSAQGAEGSWTNPIVASGELADEVARLKAQPGSDILVHGGAILAQALAAHGLIDEYKLVVHPVALGKGIPLFSELSEPVDLQLLSATTFRNGVMAHVYRPAAPRQ